MSKVLELNLKEKKKKNQMYSMKMKFPESLKWV